MSIASDVRDMDQTPREHRKCGTKTTVYSRVTGFMRPKQQWNKGKQSEDQDRKEYNVEGKK